MLCALQTSVFIGNEFDQIATQLSNAVCHIHARGVCHNDIKVDNILVSYSHLKIHVSLCDFETATIMEDDCVYTTRVAPLDMGSLFYKAPEHCQRGTHVSLGLSDMWNLGVVLVVCNTLQFPFSSQFLSDCSIDIGTSLKVWHGSMQDSMREGDGERMQMIYNTCLPLNPINRVTAQQLSQIISKTQ